MKPIRVMHLITGLGVGGAEMMLCKLLIATDRTRQQCIVYSILEDGPLSETLRTAGIEVMSLGLPHGSLDLRAFPRFTAALRLHRPDVLQTWMYHADLLGGLAAVTVGGPPVIWNIRQSNFQPRSSDRTRHIAWACARLSTRVPARIVTCADSARIAHEQIGYDASKMLVIPNGFDLSRYYPHPDAREYCREHYGIPESAGVIALIGRYHPQKDHRTFFRAAHLLSLRFPTLHFILCGDGITIDNLELKAMLDESGLSHAVHLLGRRDREELARILSRSIVCSSSSFGEAFSNVIGEGMACGSVCVVTDVGDSSAIIGDTGITVPHSSPEALAAGLGKVLAMNDEQRSAAGRASVLRVTENFSIGAIARRYEDLYQDIGGRKESTGS